MSRKTIHEEAPFRLSYEEEQGELFIHVEIYEAKKSVLERILWEFAKFKAWAYFQGYEEIYSYTKDNRLFRIFGAEEVGEFVLKNEKYKVGKWVLN
jgi:hypothetical protein